MSTTQANAVPDTQLGLSYEEIQLLRQGQAALGQGAGGGGGGGSSSSRAASRASSQGLLLLDSTSLAALGRYFDRVMGQIEQQIVYLSEQSQMFTMAQFDRAGNLIEGADAEIQRYHELLRQLDELELDFDRIRHIKEIVRGYRARVEEMERELERSGSGSSSRHREGHHSSHRHGHSHGHRHGHESSRRHRH
ncbi:hypothetical protein CH063_01162 [Colletotrichum higginsianum]|uniref:Biogenesis of lysosome-related organelles complex 1 subunit CNL1 n=3 Tax=Colletotrichum destructivum species complex TaxID=2707350 RepID=H1V2W8_COLHI|nr:hypothetical protein CH63R_07223 [Colletotrichum higginsianum IMI 349063]OBR08458.1 hypothetical protein CH63R_07223 [Colletotrichum higginsianum IMI 349063]TIC95256.1 hypothetical protein CH35J_008840 [Colletotrichum higginsianum]TQN67053.1 hypothetical protein CSHISOI_08427 [Colletotrichum shisoi]CCF34570.1 hypothetical protein CH063_01162 [Colletotrichum higginsianum]